MEVYNTLKTEGILIYHVNSDMKGFEKSYKKSRESLTSIDFRLGTKLIISDVSGETDNGWIYNYPTPGGYTVKLSEYEEFNNAVISEFASFIILQSYEAFKRLVKRILADYYQRHNVEAFKHKVIRHRKNPFINWILDIFSSRNRKLTDEEILNSLTRNPGKQDSQYFKYLRRLSVHYRNYELNNNRNIDFQGFHKLFALCRQAITHNNSILKEVDIKNFSTFQKKLLTALTDKKVKGGIKISLNQKNTSKILVIICEHAFLIYKSISLREGYDWRILKNMK